ncbi:MAG: hypothetical protein HY303_05885 [Candidatus Wallbacteria bacterium]|nr:hypothetical protein [Candidatus Wallbacteria bacterium]
MSVIDLSYAKGKQSEQEQKEVVLAVATRGWGWGWALYENDQPATCGFFRVPDHDEGHPLTHAKKCVLAFGELIHVGQRHRFQALVTDQKDHSVPAASLLPILCAMSNAAYAEADRDWLDQIGLKRKELGPWATVFLGKPPEDETVTQSLGLGNWWVRRRKLQRGQL